MDALALPVQLPATLPDAAACTGETCAALEGGSAVAFDALLAAQLLGLSAVPLPPGTQPENGITGREDHPQGESEWPDATSTDASLALTLMFSDGAQPKEAAAVHTAPERSLDITARTELVPATDVPGRSTVESGTSLPTAANTAGKMDAPAAAQDTRLESPVSPGAASLLREPEPRSREEVAAAGEPAHATLVHVQAPEARIVAAPTTASLAVDAPVGSAGFSDALSKQVVWLASKDAEVAELKLNPPELGPIQVRITVTGDEASAVFVSPVAEVRSAIEGSLEKLRSAFAEAGIALGDTAVNAESSDHGPSERRDGPHAAHRGNAFDEGWGAVTPREVARRGLVDVYA